MSYSIIQDVGYYHLSLVEYCRQLRTMFVANSTYSISSLFESTCSSSSSKIFAVCGIVDGYRSFDSGVSGVFAVNIRLDRDISIRVLTLLVVRDVESFSNSRIEWESKSTIMSYVSLFRRRWTVLMTLALEYWYYLIYSWRFFVFVSTIFFTTSLLLFFVVEEPCMRLFASSVLDSY